MAGDNTVNMLVHMNVTSYLELNLVDGSVVYHLHRPHMVPATPRKAMTTALMETFERNWRRAPPPPPPFTFTCHGLRSSRRTRAL